MFVVCMYAFLMWLFFLVWKGVVGIFGDMGKNFRVCR